MFNSMAFFCFLVLHGAEPSRARAVSGAESFEARARHTGDEPFKARAPSHTFHDLKLQNKGVFCFLGISRR